MLSEYETLELIKLSYERTTGPNKNVVLNNFIMIVNNELDFIGLKIAKGFSPQNGMAVYAMINTIGDEIALLGTEYSPLEIKYLKELIEFMVTKRSKCLIGSGDALQLVKSVSNTLSKRDAEGFLDQLVNDQ
ncbi:hypothetical protein HK096_010724, partial [Nowakowskiella sp. JEL0078]